MQNSWVWVYIKYEGWLFYTLKWKLDLFAYVKMGVTNFSNDWPNVSDPPLTSIKWLLPCVTTFYICRHPAILLISNCMESSYIYRCVTIYICSNIDCKCFLKIKPEITGLNHNHSFCVTYVPRIERTCPIDMI